MEDLASTVGAPRFLAGSYRDRSGRVVEWNNRIFRSLSPAALSHVEHMKAQGDLEQLETHHGLWPSTLLDATEIPPELAAFSPSGRVLEHPRLEFVSYPYEWPFSLLKRAALYHLDVHLAALERNLTLVDGSAYNVQFVGVRPVFIDTLSFVPYIDGSPWIGYRQFCEQFLNPLVLASRLGVGFHGWYRGELNGIPLSDMARLFSWRHKLSLGVFFHITLHARLQEKMQRSGQTQGASERKIPKARLEAFLKSLRGFVRKLKPRRASDTFWRDYEVDNSYAEPEAQEKLKFVGDVVRRLPGSIVWDVGCNSGAFSEAALQNGAARVIGLDADVGALEAAVARADAKNLPFLPLYADFSKPSPNQGWSQNERPGLLARRNADIVLALALIHHMVIGNNVPLENALDWLLSLAPTGVIEFVPKTDPMIQQMLATREDIFVDYDYDSFVGLLRQRAEITDRMVVSESGRELFAFKTMGKI